MFIVYVLLGAFLRRWYGGMFDDEKHPILGNRGLQTVCMIIAFMSIFVTDVKIWQQWVTGILLSCWLQFQFWSRAHGPCFDIGRDKEPSERTIERYNERWYHYPLDWIFKDHKYGFLYDFFYMGLRYTCPMIIPAILFDSDFLRIGACVSPIYAFMWTAWEDEPWIHSKKEWLDAPTKWAELIIGAIVYGGIYLIWENICG